MTHKIEAIFLDTGNTLRIVVKDADFQAAARQQIARLIGTQESPDILCERLITRYATYKESAYRTLLQASEKELWTRWMLPEFPSEMIMPLASKLTRLWLDQSGRRIPHADVRHTIVELSNRGYLLGIIANSVSETEIPEWLAADGLAQYFKTIMLSAKFGRRKPDPYIFLEAARSAGVKPENCAYVGDNPSRDIQGARQAGYGMVLILLEQATLEKEPARGKYKPDGVLSKCSDMLNIFFPRSDI